MFAILVVPDKMAIVPNLKTSLRQESYCLSKKFNQAAGQNK
ncbi:hypothetical protein LPE509_01259 [Legionella pneumophila subsp. pneumophila LPE509]|nr:hypothetical protein LPE509_01259 [Legionella pneumophila subsp. pneumophila LPE509]